MTINITMPALSPTMTEGTLAKWLKSEGEQVEAGDVLCEIETDKATMEVEAVDDGVLGKILVTDGTENVPVNDVIAVLLEDGENANDIGDVSVKPSVVIPSEVEESKDVSNISPLPTVGRDDNSGGTVGRRDNNKENRIFASPLARRIAKDKGLDLATIKGSGPRGRIIKNDIISLKIAISDTVQVTDSNLKTNVYGMAYKELPNNNIRKVVAKRLTESKQTVPHFYLTVECIIDDLLSARKNINDKANGEYKISVNDFIIKAAAMTLKAFPSANVSWTETAIHQYIKSDISVAVSTPTGLITPIIFAAEDKGLREISTQMKDLAGRAREGKLKPVEFMGGSFSISNLGMFGVKEFAAIVNPPQGCILAVGAGEQRPVVINGSIEIRTVMNCTLSVDHRCVDGAVGAEYLKIFKQYIENPVSMLV